MIDEKIIIAVGAALSGAIVGAGIVYFTRHAPDMDIKPLKDSMRSRYRDAMDLKLEGDAKAAVFSKVRESIKNDIRSLYPKQYHPELMAHNDILWSEYFNLA